MKSRLMRNALNNIKNIFRKMRAEIQRVLSMKKFFNIIQTTQSTIKYSLEKPSKILLNNIHRNWLKFVYNRTSKHMPVFIDENYVKDKATHPYGFLKENILKYANIEHNISEYNPINQSTVQLKIIIPQQDVMQYFIQWQRYRKFWWSSITTTPSLFTVNDIKYGDNTADVEIIAQFPWGKQPVETITVNRKENVQKDASCLSCTMALEGALLTLLLDGLNNQNEEGYLRLHRVMAPYKISFALDCEGQKLKETLQDLTNLLHYRLKIKNISTLLPNWSLSLDSQIKENLQIGVTYTAILDEKTLENGIFHLMNSSTMLKEEVHIADFDSYAFLLCGK